jgi:hypothetical protein
LIPNPKEGDHEASKTLDIVFPNHPRTQPQGDNAKNNLDVGEQKEGIGEPKIDISTAKLPANFDPLPTSPARKTTSLVDGDQQNVDAGAFLHLNMHQHFITSKRIQGGERCKPSHSSLIFKFQM